LRRKTLLLYTAAGLIIFDLSYEQALKTEKKSIFAFFPLPLETEFWVEERSDYQTTDDKTFSIIHLLFTFRCYHTVQKQLEQTNISPLLLKNDPAIDRAVLCIFSCIVHPRVLLL